MEYILLIVAVVVGLFVLRFAMRHWRGTLIVGIVAIIVAVALCFAGIYKCPFSKGHAPRLGPAPDPGPGPIDPGPHQSQTFLPDLVIENVQQQPPGAMQSKTTAIQFIVTVANRGRAPYPRYIVVQGPGNAQGGVQGLQPGETKVARVPLLSGASGPGQVVIGGIFLRVDPDNVITELNEGNNQSGPYSVTLY